MPLDKIEKFAKATEGKSCSDLAAIVNDCGRRAIYAGKKSVKVKDFEKSIDIISENQKERQLIGFHR